MAEIFGIIDEVGLPIAGALVSGFFIFTIIKQMLSGVLDQIDTLMIFTKGLETRARTMNNEIVKIDMLVSSALELTPPIDRIARSENFVEDGKIDVRRD